jgi:hypothetical protein
LYAFEQIKKQILMLNPAAQEKKSASLLLDNRLILIPLFA